VFKFQNIQNANNFSIKAKEKKDSIKIMKNTNEGLPLNSSTDKIKISCLFRIENFSLFNGSNKFSFSRILEVKSIPLLLQWC